MNKYSQTVCITLLTCLICASSASAQQQAPQIGAVEIFGCNFKDGKKMDNLNTVARHWNQWADQNKINDYTAMTLVPIYHSAEVTTNVLWLGAWPNGPAMGEGLNLWLTKGQNLLQEFDGIMKCDVAMMFASMNIRPPKGAPEAGSLVGFSDCKVHEHRTVSEAITALQEWSKFLADKGLDIPAWILFPAAGAPNDAKYNFKYVIGYGPPQNYGKLFQVYDPEKADALFGRLLDCNSDRIYLMNPVRVTQPASQ